MRNLLWLALAGMALVSCADDGAGPQQPGPDLAVTRAYLRGNSEDPRGTYYPNTPFLWYFGPLSVSLTVNAGTGTLWFDGLTASSGTFSYQGRARVGGSIGSYLFAIPPGDENTAGTWKRSGEKVILDFGQRRDTVTCGADGQALFFITSGLTNIPPVSALSVDVDPGSGRDTLVWVFKR